MKISFLLSFAVLFSFRLLAQSVGINNTTPHASAILDVKSSNKGVLLPRTSTISRNAIVSPAKGLLLYDTTTSGFWFHNGSAWAQLSGAGNGWSLTGNSSTNPATNFLGTIDNQPLRFRVNNTWAGEIHPETGNVFLGLGSGNTGTTGQANTGSGEHTLYSLTDGTFNVANGYYALSVNTAGYSNTANGAYSLTNNTTGNSNTGVGRNALFANISGAANTAVGTNALLTNTTGTGNTANGFQALYSNTASYNTAVGSSALYTNTTAINNSAFGYSALTHNTTGSSNTGIGEEALGSNQTGDYNTSIGYQSLYFNTSGSNNTATGSFALLFNNTGIDNTANGNLSLWANTTGSYNTASGYLSLYSNVSGISNTAAGYRALYLNKGSYNTASGVDALSDNTTGFSNTAYGGGALSANTDGGNNTAVGSGALYNNINGSYNISIGFQSGTGGVNGGNLTNTIGIGNDGGFLNGQSNQAIVGNASMIFIGGKVPWSVVSDERVKNNITEDVVGLNFIMKLRPVTYHISTDAINKVSGNKKTADFAGKYDGDKIKYTGFLAQEVEKAAKTANYNFSGYSTPKTENGLYTLSYEQFVVPLVKAVQEQEAIIDRQQTINDKQQSEIDDLKILLSQMKSEMELLKDKK